MWAYKYTEPSLDENDRIRDTAVRDSLFAEHERLGEEVLSATYSWIAAATAQDKAGFAACEVKRAALTEQLRIHYWKLDPYLRARTLWDRTGAINDFYSQPSSEPLSRTGGSLAEMTIS